MQIAAYLYPWDVLDDPAAPERIAGLGLDHVILAAGYHATRALTPRHPQHRVVTVPHSAAYYPTGDTAWRGSELRPAVANWLGQPDPFGTAVRELTAAGVAVDGWLVLNHVDLPTGAGTTDCVVNAYGDRYPWALCPARDAVLRYAVTYAAEVAARPGIAGIELEACGWYGFDHLSAHDKTAGMPPDEAHEYLLSLCFCAACHLAYRRGGIHPQELADRVRDALQPAFEGTPGPGLPADLIEAVGAVRHDIADRFRAQVVAAARQAAAEGTVALHATPRPEVSTAFTGVDVSVAGSLVDTLVVNCWRGADAVPAARGPAGVAASLLAVSGMGGRPAELPAQVEAARTAGATAIRLYHAGLASTADLAAVAQLRAATSPADSVRVGGESSAESSRVRAESSAESSRVRAETMEGFST
jgi:hypothetical protein